MKTYISGNIKSGNAGGVFALHKIGTGFLQGWQYLIKFVSPNSANTSSNATSLKPRTVSQAWPTLFQFPNGNNADAVKPLYKPMQHTSNQWQLEVHRDPVLFVEEEEHFKWATAEKLTSVAFFKIDANTNTLSGSSNLIHLLGVPANFALKDFQALCQLFDNQGKSKLATAWANILRDTASYTCTLPLQSDQGKRWLKLTLQSSCKNEALRYVTGTLQDVTEFEQATLEWQNEKDKLKKALKLKSEYVAMMSHEIRTPLNAIVSNAHLLLNTSVSSQQQNTHLAAIEFSSQSLIMLINNALDLSKMEAGKIELEKERFDLMHYVRGVHQSLYIKASEKQLAFTIEADENIPANVLGDPGRLIQILNNLLGNAIKFTAAGSVSLCVKLIYDTARSCVIEFSVKDTGIGIPIEKQEAIFESYTQASTDTNRQYGGTGLGLTITKQLVHLHKGKLSVESRPGMGTVFRVLLPYEKEVAATIHAQPRPDQEPDMKLKGKRILLVEDNEFNQAFTNQLLSGWHAKVETAANGLQAVAKALANPFDMMLLDLHMPVMDGFQAIRQIRANGLMLPILVFTANSSETEKQKISELGGNAYLTKPIPPHELYKSLAQFA